MMITAIEIENFKAIRDRVRVEFKPITLLFGPNSAGKSTIVQALHYGREILARHNLDPDRTICGGDAVELGGFRNFVYDHDIDRSIVLRFDLDLSKTDLPFHSGFEGPTGNVPSGLQELVSREAVSGWVQLTLQWSHRLGVPVVSAYEVGLNDKRVARITASLDRAQVIITDIDFNHPLFVERGQDQVSGNTPPSVLEALYSELTKTATGDRNLGVRRQASAMPNLDDFLSLNLEWDDEQFESYFEIAGLLDVTLLGPGRLLRDALWGFRYLGPLRRIPPRNYEPARSKDESRWASGLAAWDALHGKGSGFVSDVNEWLSRGDRLNSGYKLRMKRYVELECDTPLMVTLMTAGTLMDIEDVQGEVVGLSEKQRLVITEEGKNIEILPPDVGVGISQVLPVIVAALDDSAELVTIEQPELHIHPALQVTLGDLFLSQVANGGRTFLLETHSEHLLLRLLRRIRETAADELPPGTAPLRPEQLAVFYVEQTPDGAKVSKLRVDETGEFIDRWPKGFFEERVDELF